MHTTLDPLITSTDIHPASRRSRSQTGPLLLLALGVITLVVAASVAITTQLLPQPHQDGRTGHPGVPPAQSVEQSVAPVHGDPPPPSEAPVPVETAIPPAAELPPADPPVAPPLEPAKEVEHAVEEPAPPEVEFDEVDPVEPAPPLVGHAPVPAFPQVPDVEKPRLRDRILSKIPGLDRLGGFD